MTVRVDELGRLREQLEELLTLLEQGRAEPAALARALHSCSLVFDALQAGFPDLGQLDGDDRARLAHELESTLRLNAVALSRATAAGEELVAGIAHSKRARRHAGALAAKDATGRACDVSV